MELNEFFFALLRSEIFGERLDEKFKIGITSEVLSEMFSIANAHDMAHIICEALEKNGLLSLDDKVSQGFDKKRLLAFYRYQKQEYEFKRICDVLNSEKIPFVPLKGAVIRKYYDEAWLRTSCDIDILIKENDLKKSVDALVGHLGYKTDGKREFHDISLFSESGVHLELHFNILSNLEAIDKLLGSVWEHTVLSERGSFEYCLDNEFFMFYLTAHMASHVLSGGCGIRSIMDMKIMRMNLKYDEQKVINSCKQCGIDTFYLSVKKLSDIWFSGVCHDENSVKMENYILNGGIYGVMKTGIAAKMETGGRLKYALHRIFQPYYVIKEKYPILKKYPVLTPFYEVRRWIDIVIRGRAKASIKELEINSKVTKEDVAKVKDMLSAFGL